MKSKSVFPYPALHMASNEKLRRLSRKMIRSQRKSIALEIRYVLESGGTHGIFANRSAPISLTGKRRRLLEILTLTMGSSSLLVSGGMARHLRTAQRELRNFRKAGLVAFVKYPVYESGAFHYFYAARKAAFAELGEPETPFHRINSGTLAHDSLTALFLIHLFRSARGQGMTVRWHPPFALKDKICDGGVTILRGGTPVRSLLLETDRGTHGHAEIADKIEAYLPCVVGHPKRAVVFLVSGETRARNILNTLLPKIPPPPDRQVMVLCPENFPNDMDVCGLFRTTEPERASTGASRP